MGKRLVTAQGMSPELGNKYKDGKQAIVSHIQPFPAKPSLWLQAAVQEEVEERITRDLDQLKL